jgi:hypothetical protein
MKHIGIVAYSAAGRRAVYSAARRSTGPASTL